ncbi:hypothetical protein Tco_0447120 [Tanacetum coccineum]
MPEHETTTTLESHSREERNKNDQPSDDWFSFTQSRRGNSWTATFHLLSSGIRTETLSLPLAFYTWDGNVLGNSLFVTSICMAALHHWIASESSKI